MWRKRFFSSHCFAVLVSVLVLLVCICSRCALGLDRQEYAVKMSAGDGWGATNTWSGGIIAQTEVEYLIATCSHGAAQGVQVYAQLHGMANASPCRPVWWEPPSVLDLALWAVPRPEAIDLPLVPPPAPRPEVGDYLTGWGHVANSQTPRKFGGYVRVTGLGYAGPAANGSAKMLRGSLARGPWDQLDCQTASGDSGSVLWTPDGRPAGVQWGSRPGETIYTPLVYAAPLWAKKTQWCWQPQGRAVVRRQPQGWRPPVTGPRVQPPPVSPQPPPVVSKPPQPDPCAKYAGSLEGAIASIAKAEELLDELAKKIDGVEGKIPPPTDLSDYATRQDLADMEGRLVVIINQRFEQLPPPVNLPGPARHLVVIAEQFADYWTALDYAVKRARNRYYDVRVAPPAPGGFGGVMPKAVEYVDGTPVGIHEGLEDVQALLSSIAKSGRTASVADGE